MDAPELSPEERATLPARAQAYLKALEMQSLQLAEENRQLRVLIKSKSLSTKSRLRVARLSGKP